MWYGLGWIAARSGMGSSAFRILSQKPQPIPTINLASNPAINPAANPAVGDGRGCGCVVGLGHGVVACF